MANRNDDFNTTRKTTGNPVTPQTTTTPGTTKAAPTGDPKKTGNTGNTGKTGVPLDKDRFAYEVAQEIGVDLPLRNS